MSRDKTPIERAIENTEAYLLSGEYDFNSLCCKESYFEGVQESLKTLKEILNEENKSPWISVEDELPADESFIWVVPRKVERVEAIQACIDTYQEELEFRNDYTHWMLIQEPELP